MKNIRRRLTHLAGIAVMMVPLLITVYLLYWSPTDLSARQTEDQRVFGATYMTMNNPYFQVLDTQIRAHVELRGDILDALLKDGRDYIEVVFHPATVAESPYFGNISTERVREFEFVYSKEVYEKYKANGIEFVNFEDLK